MSGVFGLGVVEGGSVVSSGPVQRLQVGGRGMDGRAGRPLLGQGQQGDGGGRGFGGKSWSVVAGAGEQRSESSVRGLVLRDVDLAVVMDVLHLLGDVNPDFLSATDICGQQNKFTMK